MSRAHCVDCATDVTVDSLGQCPAGHLLPVAGRRVESAIGSADHHPDEPEPWVAYIELEAEPEAAATASATPPQPRAAPGEGPAAPAAGTDPSDLLRELGALGADDEPAPTRGDEPAPTRGDEPAPTRGDEPTPTNGPTAANGHPATTGPPAAGPTEVGDLTALEQAVQALGDDAPASDPARATPPAPAAPDASRPAAPSDADDDLSALLHEFDLGDAGADAPATGADPHAAPEAPAPEQAAAGAAPAWEALADAASGLAAEGATDARDDDTDELTPASPDGIPGASAPSDARPADRHAPEGWGEQGRDEAASEPAQAAQEPAPAEPRPTMDTMNFTAKGNVTAKGGAANGRRRRRLLGR